LVVQGANAENLQFARGESLKKITGGNAKLTYFVGGKTVKAY
jgi:hypothetical protein